MRGCRPLVRLFWYFWVYRNNEAEPLSELSVHTNKQEAARGKHFLGRAQHAAPLQGSRIEVRLCEF